MPDIQITSCGPEGLARIRSLWEQLNEHHESVSPHFAERFADGNFSHRAKLFDAKSSEGRLRVFIAEAGRPVGYCVVTLGAQGHGEIESIFITQAYRGRKIGDTLMRAALDWLDVNGAVSKSVSVVFGNEQAFPFYAKYGFLPRTTVLSQR